MSCMVGLQEVCTTLWWSSIWTQSWEPCWISKPSVCRVQR